VCKVDLIKVSTDDFVQKVHYALNLVEIFWDFMMHLG